MNNFAGIIKGVVTDSLHQIVLNNVNVILFGCPKRAINKGYNLKRKWLF